MGVDVLAPCVARASTPMILTMLNRINSVPAPLELSESLNRLLVITRNDIDNVTYATVCFLDGDYQPCSYQREIWIQWTIHFKCNMIVTIRHFTFRGIVCQTSRPERNDQNMMIKWKYSCNEFTVTDGLTLTKNNDEGLWCFLWSSPEETIETPVIWDVIALMMTSL